MLKTASQPVATALFCKVYLHAGKNLQSLCNDDWYAILSFVAILLLCCVPTVVQSFGPLSWAKAVMHNAVPCLGKPTPVLHAYRIQSTG